MKGIELAQDQESGARAVNYGLETAKLIAEKLGYKKTKNPRSNEYAKEGKTVAIKCAHARVGIIGVTYKMLDRISSVLACFERDNGDYDIYEISPGIYRRIMTPTRSTGSSTGKVGIALRTDIIKNGKYIQRVNL